MKWHYNIIKDKKEYYLAERFIGLKKFIHTYTIVSEAYDSPEELTKDLLYRLVDAYKYPILQVKKGKLCKIKVKSCSLSGRKMKL